MKYRMKLGKDTGTRYLVISSNGVVLVIFVGISVYSRMEGRSDLEKGGFHVCYKKV